MNPQLISRAARVGNVIESVVSAVRTGRPALPPLKARIAVFRTLGSRGTLTVCGQVIRQAALRPSDSRLAPQGASTQFIAVYRAFDVREVAGAVVSVARGSVSTTIVTDAGGFFEAKLQAPENSQWPLGWNNVSVSCNLGGEQIMTNAEVFVPDQRAQLLLISDIDDTAMDSDTVSSPRMLRKILFRPPSERLPVPGIPELYTALHNGINGIQSPVCYISSGAWNLYDVVRDYLDTHRMPRGGMYMNDWGSRVRQFRAVAHSHKLTRINTLMADYPELPVLLVGDDTQEDPELYMQAALENPGRIAAIWIRRVRTEFGRSRAVLKLRNSLQNSGVKCVYSANSEAFAEQARAYGWIK